MSAIQTGNELRAFDQVRLKYGAIRTQVSSLSLVCYSVFAHRGEFNRPQAAERRSVWSPFHTRINSFDGPY